MGSFPERRNSTLTPTPGGTGRADARPAQELAAAKSPDDKTRLQRQIDATDCEIDSLVCDLYGLSEEEVAIMEGAAGSDK